MARKNWGGGGWGGGRVDDNNILTFFATGSTKKMPLKKLHFGNFFPFVYVKFLNS